MRRRDFVAAAGGAAAAALAAGRPHAARSDIAESAQPVTAAAFGLHCHRLVDTGEERASTAWPDLSFGSLRLWDTATRWADICPARGVFEWKRMDALVGLAEAHGCTVLYTLGSTPRWASARPGEPGPYGPGCAAEPRDTADWQDYVRRVVERYRGRIGAYEVWNEPYFSDHEKDADAAGAFFTGTARHMVELTRLARQALRVADPAARLFSPAFVGNASRLARFLGEGGAPLLDGVAFHLYESDAAHFQAQVLSIREAMARNGIARLPLWNTEFGFDTGAAADRSQPGQAADRLAQFFILGAANGLARSYYYAWDNRRTGLIGPGPGRSALHRAFEQSQQWLVGTELGAVAQSAAGSFRIDAWRDGAPVCFAWSERPTVLDLSRRAGAAPASARLASGAAVPIERSGADGWHIATSQAPARIAYAANATG